MQIVKPQSSCFREREAHMGTLEVKKKLRAVVGIQVKISGGEIIEAGGTLRVDSAKTRDACLPFEDPT